MSVVEENSAASLLEIRVVHDPSINFAFQQNAIPVVRELRVTNTSDRPLRDLAIVVRTEPAFAQPLELRVQELAPAAEFRVSPLDLVLRPEFLSGLAERVRGLLHVEVREGETTHAQHASEITLLARHEWCGLVSLPEILAAFVLPNDPAVTTILGRAAELLRASTGRAALNGYQDKSRQRAWEQVAAIHAAIVQLGLRYIAPPASFEQTGQKVRFPSEMCAQRFGTCLDLALLFAACCEQAGLHPLVLLQQDHAYAGCWLEERTLPEPATDDLQSIRKLVDLEELTIFEATHVTDEKAGALDQAELLAKAHLAPKVPFRLALDIRRARIARILPLPIPGADATSPSEANETIGPGAPENPPELGRRVINEHAEISSAVSSPRAPSRIDQWKSRLLDLTLRNRLLSFRKTLGTVEILCPNPELVEDELAANRELKLAPRPAVMSPDDPRNAALHTRRQGEDAQAEHLRKELAEGRLHTTLAAAENHARLTEIFRAARLSLEESGSNTLFAAVGFLEWRETEHSDRVHRAPLLLVPVELKRKSVLEGFFLRRIDEETRLNVTLMEMLRQYFHKEISGLDPLPGDETGVDVAQVFRRFQEAVRDLPGWEVKREVWLGQFSFTKFLLWKDLADRLDALARNRVVHHMVHEAGAGYPNPPDDFFPAQLDDRVAPAEVFCPRSADSSQLAAVLSAAAGHDFVLEGPPGTGKSQTITNIIAHCLAHGKRVLFVAEKRAALDVVQRRLKEEGLEAFCLELHSNKTGKAEVLAQFKQSLDFAALREPADWTRRTAQLQKARDELNAYVRALHRELPNGLSAHACLDHLLPRRELPMVKLEQPGLLEHTAEDLEQRRAVATALAERAAHFEKLTGHPLTPLHCAEWSPAWAEQARAQMATLAECAVPAQNAAAAMRAWLQLPATMAGKRDLETLDALASLLLAALPVGPDFVTTPWDQLARDLDGWKELAVERAALRAQLPGYDEARLLALNLVDCAMRWQSAQASWFLPKMIGSKKVRAELATARNDGNKPDAADVADVLQRARRLGEINAAFAAAASEGTARLGALWNKGEPSPDALAQARTWGEKLHAALLALAGDDLALLRQLRQLLAAVFAEGVSLLARDATIGARLVELQRAHAAFNEALDAFATTVALDRAVIDAAPDHLGAARTLVERVEGGWKHIRHWCAWQKSRAQAFALGLGPLVEVIERDEAPPALVTQWFERSYRRAVFDAVLNNEPVLRQFFGDEHEARIRRFRQLDEDVTRLTRELIRARLAARVPRDSAEDAPPKSELGLLRKEIGKRARHIPVRQLLARIPTLLPRLKPCVLMSPLSVAQYLEPAHEQFDLVVFDEASQIPVWDAVGAIARGTQLVVVGDPKQLPPTNFFNRGEDADEDADPGEQEDLESILDELLGHGLRHKRLEWHYRSRHESLIAFSNRQYYEDKLLTFPSPDGGRGGVQFHFVEGARYDKGKARVNRGEAEALVAELVRRLREPSAKRLSFGVVTFSQAQQALVEDLLDEQRRQFPEIDDHFGDDAPVEGEPVFVKNLENVQGDERDVIFFSICYGPDEAGRVSMNFGPLNRDGGERRLNVAITRAKREVVVFSTLRGEQIDLTRSRARGVRDLKFFLEFAERGPRTLAAAPSSSSKGATASSLSSSTAPAAAAKSEFEDLVAERLRQGGHEVHRRVGCSGYRIDLAIVDPRAPGTYLLGVECDGDSYQRAATARDRDKLRQAVLENLGWRLHRVWSTDWWHDADEQMERLNEAIAEARRAPRRTEA